MVQFSKQFHFLKLVYFFQTSSFFLTSLNFLSWFHFFKPSLFLMIIIIFGSGEAGTYNL